MRTAMNVTAIAAAVNARMDELPLRPVELMRRMGTNATTVNNLRNPPPGKKGFRPETLRTASRALEWPERALAQIGAGEDADLEHVPWVEDSIEARVGRMESEFADLKTLVRDALGLPPDDDQAPR